MSVPAAGTDQRIAVYGAVDYASGRVVWQMASQKDGTGFAAFLECVARAWPKDDLVLVLDNVSYHRSPSMQRTTTRASISASMLPGSAESGKIASTALVTHESLTQRATARSEMPSRQAGYLP